MCCSLPSSCCGRAKRFGHATCVWCFAVVKIPFATVKTSFATVKTTAQGCFEFVFRMHAGLSMLEQEQRWDLIQQGRAEDYHGVAVHPRHLSLFEKAVLKRHRQYRRQADVQMATL